MDAPKMQFMGTGEGIGMGETAVLKATTDACDACEGVHDDESLAYGPAALHALADGLFARGWMDASAAAFEDDRAAIVRLARGIGWNEDSIEPFETAALGDMQAFIRESFVAGMPHAVLPIESLYTMRGYDGETSAKNLRSYLNEPARHMSVVLSDLAVETPEAFKSMPDHLTIELEVFCLFVEAGNASAAARFAADHLSWIAGYRARLLGVRAATGIDRRLSDQARESCATGAAFADAALSLIEAYLEASLAEASMPS